MSTHYDVYVITGKLYTSESRACFFVHNLNKVNLRIPVKNALKQNLNTYFAQD
ncbi:uncharacterized protein PHALS_14155 [Plasmopara halstedii]|uniref:Uncharacterized protein n=1 Tax=Plasmopara halstedii TaxID=4781 RepID=A0A0N7L6C2_PLAHL|nr:uncharacterized protein PHALS_14155 [Plasmopara halstedii]CEG43867.1 hypothetical protein PHALS_14155 [Plasmopara halstedii]|eukprot:XP_024580236.1 hypothetical protein PHALS_14155 [Plasmopara halstedii]